MYHHIATFSPRTSESCLIYNQISFAKLMANLNLQQSLPLRKLYKPSLYLFSLRGVIKRLKKTFIHIPGIGKSTEEKIWQSKAYNWYEFLENQGDIPLCNSRIIHISSYIHKSIIAYDQKEFGFFSKRMPVSTHWRAYPDLKDRCCFLDIESTGLDKDRDDVTVIGLYDGKESKFFINGINLDEFPKEIEKYPMIVTFNGRCFDIPFLKEKFPEVDFDKFHIDLRFAMKQIGFSGGLKRIERTLGLARDDELREVDGFEAVRLWYRYKKGDQEALNLLLRYNKADIENLKFLMDYTFERLKEKEFYR